MNIKSVLIACAVVASSAFAEEMDASASAVTSTATKKAGGAAFSTLPLCALKEGLVEVCKPGGEWIPAEEGKFYPLGSSFRTGKDGHLSLSFGAESSAMLAADSEMGTRSQSLGGVSRTIVLVRGTVNLSLADNLPEGAFFVTAPGFVVKNPAGRSRYVYEDKGDGDQVTVRCVTGMLGVEGRHFEIPSMHPADEIVIRTSHDRLATFLSCTSGDYVVRLDKGVSLKNEVGDDGQIKHVAEKSSVDWRLSTRMKIMINRMVPAIGERLSVHTMVFDATGAPQGRGISFCEGRAEVNFGEIGVKENAVDESAKQAAEATETTDATDEEESSGEEKKKSGNGTSESNEE